MAIVFFIGTGERKEKKGVKSGTATALENQFLFFCHCQSPDCHFDRLSFSSSSSYYFGEKTNDRRLTERGKGEKEKEKEGDREQKRKISFPASGFPRSLYASTGSRVDCVFIRERTTAVQVNDNRRMGKSIPDNLG